MNAKREGRRVKRGLLHPRNPHKGRYDLKALCKIVPELKEFLRLNPKGEETIDFSNSDAVLYLNKALLKHYYQVEKWNIPTGYLCPPIPGRADYIHYLADLLIRSNQDQPLDNKKVNVLDIGTGANCIYPIIGSQSYGWQFVATDIDPVSIENANTIVSDNVCLSKKIKLKLQKNKKAIFNGIILNKDRYDLTLCNPPFHSSIKEAQESNQRKLRNLGNEESKSAQSRRNFGGKNSELCCDGGEIEFLKQMVKESVNYSSQVCWFTSLVSKNENIRPLKKLLVKLGAEQIEVIKMSQGQKISRLIAWSFLSNAQQQAWLEK